MRAEMLARPERVAPPAAVATEDAELRAAAATQRKRVRRLQLHAAAWGVGTVALTVLWAAHEWQANGAFERLAHEGNAGDWNPTLWAVTVLVWGLVVGIMALHVRFERPATSPELQREAERLLHALGDEGPVDAPLRSLARARLERLGRLKSNVAAWALAMVLLTPVNVLIEWQDNGGFERLSRNSEPGSWDPWLLAAGGIWAGVVVLLYALPVYLDRRRTRS